MMYYNNINTKYLISMTVCKRDSKKRICPNPSRYSQTLFLVAMALSILLVLKKTRTLSQKRNIPPKQTVRLHHTKIETGSAINSSRGFSIEKIALQLFKRQENMATMGVHFDTPNGVLQAGAKVSGCVFLDTRKEISASRLKVCMYGEEFSSVTYTTESTIDHDYENENSGAGTRTITHTTTQNRQFLKNDIPVDQRKITNTKKKIPPGKYRFPFNIQLADNLPSSMHSMWSTRSFCYIKYHILVQVKGSGWISDYKSSTDVAVSAKPLPLEPVPFFREPFVEYMTSWCCMPAGSMTFGAKVENTVLGRGEKLNIAMACVNDSKFEVNDCTAFLTECVRWKANGHKNEQCRTLGGVHFGRFTGLLKKTPSTLESKRGANLLEDNYQEIFQQLESEVNKGFMTLPTGTNDSYCGQLIKVEHKIHLRVGTSGMFCATDPSITIPIQCGPPANAINSPNGTPSTMPIAYSNNTPTPQWVIEATPKSAPPPYNPNYVASGGSIAIDAHCDETADAVATLIPGSNKPPSLVSLVHDMNEYQNAVAVVKSKVSDPAWKNFFATISPEDFACIIEKVEVDFDQTLVGTLVAPLIKNGHFTCGYLVAALKVTHNRNKNSMVQTLIPFCVDLESGEASIKAELSPWQQRVTAEAFKSASASKQ